ncbi:MAG TPA: hypothetical protein VFX25_39695 [Streptosporangiaceae bacterium]|nr:hypothetical protein [Streptosporangiaceae bacterium]
MSAAAPSRPRPRRRWIWVLVALLTALVLVPPFALRIGLKIDIQHRTAPVLVAARPVTALLVDAPAGSVSISPGTGRRVTVSATAAWLVRRPAVTQAWAGSTLRVTAACPRLNPFEDCQESLDIHVPAGLTVRVSVGSGSVSAFSLTGPLHLSGTSGALMLNDVRGPVWAAVTSGNVTAQGEGAAAVHASAGSGSLELRFAAPPQLLALAVGSGSADVTVPPGTRYRVSVRTRAGVVNIQRGLGDSTSGQVITASVGTGFLAVRYAP